MIKEDGNFYNEQELTTLYNIHTNFIQYNGMIRSIKTFLSNHATTAFHSKCCYPIIPFSILNIIKHKKGCKELYNVLNRNIYKPTSKTKWEQLYQIEEESWKEIYGGPFKNQYSSMLRWFQVRINHRILPTRKYLFTIKIKDSPLCQYCQQEETLRHMLWTCTDTQKLLQDIREWLSRFNINILFIEEPFIFNIGNLYSDSDLLFILEIKYYIFSAKRLYSTLSVMAFKNIITNTYLALKCIANKNNKMEKFEKDWNKYNNLFSR